MKIVRKSEVETLDATGSPIFEGGKVARRPLIGGDASSYFNFFIVEFAAGARNKLHTHTSDQILYVTKGRGLVGAESETFEVEEGDTAFIPAGEKHWHGAAQDSDFAHIALVHPDSVTEVHA